MGMYDTVWFKNSKGEEIDIQVKVGECCLANYEVGQEVPFIDGVYFGWEGTFVVFNGKIVAAFDIDEEKLYDKWGCRISYPELSR